MATPATTCSQIGLDCGELALQHGGLGIQAADQAQALQVDVVDANVEVGPVMPEERNDPVDVAGPDSRSALTAGVFQFLGEDVIDRDDTAWV